MPKKKKLDETGDHDHKRKKPEKNTDDTDSKSKLKQSTLKFSEGKMEINSKKGHIATPGRITRSLASAKEGLNYKFYTSEIKSSPQGDFIGNIHTSWFGDWSLLEDHHGYIQWLFPIFESNGMNSKSEKLGKGEAKLIREDLTCAKRVVVSYRLMLNFYGIKLLDEETGEVERDEETWKGRFHNLNTHGHNNLRISRILQSLGQLGFRRYKKPLVEFFKTQIEDEDELSHCKRALNQFWLPLLDESSAEYAQKTKESSEDRTESVYFSYLASQKLQKVAVVNTTSSDKDEKVQVESIVNEKSVNNLESME